MIEEPTPNTDKDTAVNVETDQTAEKKPHHYQPPPPSNNTAKSKWLWLLPLIILTLVAGVILGRMWGQDQTADDTTAASDTVDADADNGSFLHRLGMAVGLVEEEKTEVLPQKPVLSVEVITAQQAVVPETLTADGTIAPKSVATVNSKVNGVTIEQVLVDEGDRVNQGDVLAIFDTDAMEQQAYQAKADLMEAQTRLQLAQSDVNRITPLVSIQAISEQERDRYVATANQAAAAVEAAKARLSNQNLTINNARVVAPVSGVISEKNANVGSVAGSGTMFTIIKDGVLEWQAKIDPSNLDSVSVGTPVQVSLPQDNHVNGQVSRIAPTADSGSRQVSIYATLNSSPMARAGMYQRGELLLGRQNKQILPSTVITSQDGYDYVILVQRDNDVNGETIYRVKRHKVTISSRQNNAVILESPLPANAAIVRQGGSFLTNGDVVTVTNLNEINTPIPAVDNAQSDTVPADLSDGGSQDNDSQPNRQSDSISPSPSESQIITPVADTPATAKAG